MTAALAVVCGYPAIFAAISASVPAEITRAVQLVLARLTRAVAARQASSLRTASRR